VPITEEIRGVSQLFGGTCPGSPQSLCPCINDTFIVELSNNYSVKTKQRSDIIKKPCKEPDLRDNVPLLILYGTTTRETYQRLSQPNTVKPRLNQKFFKCLQKRRKKAEKPSDRSLGSFSREKVLLKARERKGKESREN